MESSTAYLDEDCDICASLFDKRVHMKITCPHELCKKSTCRECFNRILLESGLVPPCMWCKKELFFGFIVKNTSSKILKEYMSLRGNLFLEREKSRLPFLQDAAEEILRQRRTNNRIESYRQELNILSVSISNVKYKLHEFYVENKIGSISSFRKKANVISCFSKASRSMGISFARKDNTCVLCDNDNRYYNNNNIKCKECDLLTCLYCSKLIILCNDRKCFRCDSDLLKKEEILSKLGVTYYDKFFKPVKPAHLKNEKLKSDSISAMNEKIQMNYKLLMICIDIEKIRYEGVEPPENPFTPSIVPKKNPQFIKKCPDIECRGFLSSAWKCGICKYNFCVDCHRKKEEIHICDEDEKATIKLLKEESKPCPSCHMPISRISGCSQVWTPCCKIAFDWNTGKIDNGRIHSPEYYAYLRRTLGDVPRERDDNCDAQLNIFTLYSYVTRPNVEKFDIDLYYRMKEHVVWVLRSLPRETDVEDHSDLGVRYLLSSITEKEWKSTLCRREKKREKDSKIYDILSTFSTIMNDLLLDVVHGTKTIEQKCILFKQNAENLVIYTNEEITKLNEIFSSKEKKYFLKIERNV